MMTLTLFYIASIVGFKPTGETFDPTIMVEYAINFDISRAKLLILSTTMIRNMTRYLIDGTFPSLLYG